MFQFLFNQSLLRKSTLCLVLTGLSLLCYGKVPKVDALSDEEAQALKAQTQWVLNLIQSRHYLHNEMQSINSHAVLENFAESLDYSKLYFTQADIQSYQFRFSDALETFFKNGNLYPAFVIYEDYTERYIARTEWVHQRLNQPFSFEETEWFNSDRSEVSWAANPAEAERTWNQYLKYQVLNELLSNTAETLGEDAEEAAIAAAYARLSSDPDYYESVMKTVREKIERRYQRNLKILEDQEISDIQELFINALTQVFDPHSSFLSTHTLENFKSSVKNSFVGIGAQLQDVDGVCTIKDILPGGPAERSNQLKAEDEILGVAQGDAEFEDVVDMRLKYIVRKIKGPKDTVVRLLIRPGDASDPSKRKIVSLVRDEVKLTANLASATVFNLPAEDGFISIGVIDLPSFYGNIGRNSALGTTSTDVKELILKLKQYPIDALILDLRANGGGLLSEAVRTAGLFIPVGPIVQVVDARGKKQVLHDQLPEITWEGPLAILTSKFSASASEIVAGALQDHERALVIGDTTTHGKGTVQEVFHMHTRMALNWFQSPQSSTPPVASKITIKQFFLPKGNSTQVKGVASDIVLPSINDLLPISESDLNNPIQWEQIEAINWYNNWKKIAVSSPTEADLMPYLSEQTRARQNDLEELLYLKADIDWRSQALEEKKVSLNLKERVSKQLLEQAQQKALEARYDALKENPYPREEILLAIREAQEADSKSRIAGFNQTETTEAASTTETQMEGDANTLTDLSPEADSEDTETDLEEDNYDIRLRESVRIMRDWVLWESGQSHSASALSALSDESENPSPSTVED